MAIVPSINSSALEAIEDRNVRDVLKQIVSGWQVRNGQSGKGDEKFLTEADLKIALEKKPVADIVEKIANESVKSGRVGYAPTGKIITDLQAQVLADPFFIFLGERVKLIDTPNTGLIDQLIGAKNGIYNLDKIINDPATGIYSQLKGVGLRVGGATTGYATLTELKADAVSASATYTDQTRAALGSQISTGDATEKSSRVNSDSALTSAINTIWSAVGDGSALASSGTNTVTTRNAATASAWNQVQATLTDPSTGRIITGVVGRTEFTATNSKIAGLSAQYTVKIDAGGYVAGYGLASGLDINGRATSRMYFRADTFAIGSPSGTVDPLTGLSSGASVPFIVKTVPTTVNGQSVPAGVYMDSAFIANGSIDNLKVGVAAIKTANIDDLAVTTLKIGNNSVTVPAYMNGFGGTVHPAGGAMQRIGFVQVSYPADVSIVGLVTWQGACGGQNTNTRAEIRIRGAGNIMAQSDSMIANYTSSHAGSGKVELGAGSYQIEFWAGNDWTGGTYTLRQWSCTLLGVMK